MKIVCYEQDNSIMLPSVINILFLKEKGEMFFHSIGF